MEPIGSLSLVELLNRIAAKTPAPGGGAVACVTGALGAALAEMVVSYSVGRKDLAKHKAELEKAAAVLGNARRVLLQLGDEDAEAYGAVNALMRQPESDPRRAAEWGPAVARAVQVPRAALAACSNLLRLMETLAPITNRHLRSDLGIAAELAESAARACRWNIEVNAAMLADAGERGRVMDETRRALAEAAGLLSKVEAGCSETSRA